MPWNASGNKYELEMSFYREKDINYNISNIFQPVDGILVIINSPDELSTQEGHHFYVLKSKHFDPKISVEITYIADDLNSWSIKKRNCFLRGEKKLEYFKIYTKSNCEQECFSKNAYKTCGCVPFYVIRAYLKHFLSIASGISF